MTFKRISQLLLALSIMCMSAFSYAEATWIDVRTKGEHLIDNIEGDALIPYQDIVAEVTQMHPDKDTEIHLYCRTGRRADVALQALQQAGYTNITNNGSIDDARETRGIVK